MKNIDKCDIVSVFMLLVFSMVLYYSGYTTNMHHAYVWATLLLFLGFIQFICFSFSEYVPTFRICCSWAAGTVWTCIALSALNMLVIIICMILSLVNFYVFSKLIDQSSEDWHNFSQE